MKLFQRWIERTNDIEEARAQEALEDFRPLGLLMPMLDVPTRWNSTSEMLERAYIYRMVRSVVL